jgi:hypothetical protein
MRIDPSDITAAADGNRNYHFPLLTAFFDLIGIIGVSHRSCALSDKGAYFYRIMHMWI